MNIYFVKIVKMMVKQQINIQTQHMILKMRF